jgi:hypothetical protein
MPIGHFTVESLRPPCTLVVATLSGSDRFHGNGDELAGWLKTTLELFEPLTIVDRVELSPPAVVSSQIGPVVETVLGTGAVVGPHAELP